MANRNALLGRSRPREKLTREEITALDKATVPPAPATTPAKPKPPGNRGGGQQRMVRRDLLKFRWSLECPGCGFKVTGEWPAPARAKARQVRPLQSGPGRDSSDQTTFPGYSSRGDTAKYNPAFQGRQMRSDAA